MWFSVGGHDGFATPEGIEEYDIIFDKKETLLYRIALNIAEVADQLAEQNKYVIANPKEY